VIKSTKIKEKLPMWFLMVSMFFFPLGYDGLFAYIMKLTGSYWVADLVFYIISGIFFVLYLFSKKWITRDITKDS
jgi:hypothetical protein